MQCNKDGETMRTNNISERGESFWGEWITASWPTVFLAVIVVVVFPLGDFVNSGLRLRLWFIPGRWLILVTVKVSVRVWGYDNKLENCRLWNSWLVFPRGHFLHLETAWEPEDLAQKQGETLGILTLLRRQRTNGGLPQLQYVSL